MTEGQLRRFVSKVSFQLLDDEFGECWVWTGARLKAGYGKVGLASRVLLAHRVAYEHFVRPIPEGAQIDHLCRTKACVNPRHLEAVQPAINCQRGLAPLRMAAIGRASKGRMNPHSAAHRAALQASHVGFGGQRHSLTTRERMAHARRVWWARKRGEAA